MSGSRVSSSRSITSISRRARWAPRQKCGPAAPKPRCGLGVPQDVEPVGVLEDLLVPVGRGVEEEHLVAGVELLARQDGVLGDGPSHPDHRAGPPHDLVDSGGGHADRVGLPDGPLVGVLGQGQDAVGDRVAGGLVAGGQQEDEERGELGVGERLAVDVGGDERGGQVVGRVFDPVGGELGHQGASAPGPPRASPSAGRCPPGGTRDRRTRAITLEQRKTVACSEGGRPIMSQMISRERGAANDGDEVALAEPGDPVDQPSGHLLDGLLDGTGRAGG